MKELSRLAVIKMARTSRYSILVLHFRFGTRTGQFRGYNRTSLYRCHKSHRSALMFRNFQDAGLDISLHVYHLHAV